MEKKVILKHLLFSYSNNRTLKIQTINNKQMRVIIVGFEKELIKYRILNNKYISSIRFGNIVSTIFENEEDEKEVLYEILNEKYNTVGLGERIRNFEHYYLEIIQKLLTKERKDSLGYINLKNKEKVYPQIFKNLPKDENNLLFYYFTKKELSNNIRDNNKSVLLIEQANLSQKLALDNALNERISIIEGPPGTGKTTSIINILANLIYQDKKVLVVSKNNSAIENVVQELANMDIPRCYIRMGNSDIMEKQLEPNIEQNLRELERQINNIEILQNEKDVTNLLKIIGEINQKEKKLNLLIKERNELQELENQLRHVRKKSEVYDVKEYGKELDSKYTNFSSENLKRKVKQLAKTLIILDEKERVDIWNKLISFIILRKNINELKQNGILMHLLLEDCYLTSLIEEKKKKFEYENFEELKDSIKKLYLERYIPISKKILKQAIKMGINVKLMQDTFKKINLRKEQIATSKNPTPILKYCKSNLIELYPIVLTTVDSVISNYWNYFNSNKKVDYVIIDESSQCDILSALPLLYIAKNIIVVGDKKQLGAITNIDTNYIKSVVEDEYDYTKENFLSSISKTINPPSKMLLEHYRCDYNIINYCNKFFYENKLKIYNDGKKGAMSLVDDNKGKYVQKIDGGYENQREIKCIDELISHDIKDKFIITPFRRQADIFRDKYGKDKCGTIHTFQGKGEKRVYLSSVLNETRECINHLSGKYNLFTNELINVAISRAKEKFILITDIKFFKSHDKNMKNLIEYIEIYGDKIPDKTVCIFDYLYRQIPVYRQVIPNIDNPFEEKIYTLLLEYIKKKDEKYKIAWKLPLAEFVTDKNYLDANKELKKFILNNSHLDFSLYNETINKPVLAIEVDGKYHELEIQGKRDRMKEEILQHMEIPLLRIPSKVTWDIGEFEKILDEKLNI